jgi:hypothetical protein
LVFIPWHLIGGTITLLIVFGKCMYKYTKKISYLYQLDRDTDIGR